ncbi:hypothetical protein D3C78_1590000 [compost metagenome]
MGIKHDGMKQKLPHKTIFYLRGLMLLWLFSLGFKTHYLINSPAFVKLRFCLYLIESIRISIIRPYS